jgi:hypothetical protein
MAATVSASSASVAGIASAVGLTGPAMSSATTSAPFAANSTAMARPIPRAAPVTIATFPASDDPRPGMIGPADRSGGGAGYGPATGSATGWLANVCRQASSSLALSLGQAICECLPTPLRFRVTMQRRGLLARRAWSAFWLCRLPKPLSLASKCPLTRVCK